MKEPILSRIENSLQRHRMATRGERVLVACSGGADSVALFHLLKLLAPTMGLRLALIHFDHRLRRDSPKDFEFVRRLARRSGVPFYGGKRSARTRRDPRLSPEEAAREMRYDFFSRIAKRTRAKKIALGHHLDDQAETLLMRLVQGTGPRGLQGIRPIVQWGRMTLIRPLLEVSRSEIRKFLGASSIPYREDPTNESREFLRNRIRHRLLPLLEKEFNPRIRESLGRLARAVASESGGLDDWIRKHWRSYIRSQRNGTIWLDRASFLRLPGALQFRLLDEVLRKVHRRSGLDFKAWKRMEEGFLKGRFRMSLPRGIDLNLTPKALKVCLLGGCKSDTIEPTKGGEHSNSKRNLGLEKIL